MRARWGTVAVALALAVTATGDGVAVSVVRAELREQAAAREADRAWVAAVRDIGLKVQSARAPVIDASHLVLADLGPVVRYDVYVRGAAAADLAAQQARLADVAAPAGRRAAHAELDGALAEMLAAVRTLADEQDEDVDDELRAFEAAGKRWDSAVTAHVAADLPLASTRGDLPLTQAGRVFRWSSTCGRAILDDEDLGDPAEEDDPRRAAEMFEGYAAHLETALDQLLAVPAATPEAQRELEPTLRGARQASEALRAFAGALRSGDAGGVRNGIVQLDLVAPLFEAASRAFQTAGSSVCADYFDPGAFLGEPTEPADDETRT